MTNAQQVTQTVAKKRRFEISVASRQTFMRFARIKGEGASSNGRVGVDRFYLDQWESRTRVALIRRFHAWTRRIVAVGNQLSREFKYLLESGERAERSSRWNAEMDFSLERRIRVIAKNRWKEKKATAARATRERERGWNSFETGSDTAFPCLPLNYFCTGYEGVRVSPRNFDTKIARWTPSPPGFFIENNDMQRRRVDPFLETKGKKKMNRYICIISSLLSVD